MRIGGLCLLSVVALFLFFPLAYNVMLAGFGLLGLSLIALGSIGHDRHRR